MFTEIYCDGFAMNTGPVGSPSPMDELQSIYPDECGVIRCHLRGCLSKDNAGKVWPDHLSGVVYCVDKELRQVERTSTACLDEWVVRSFPPGNVRDIFLEKANAKS